MLQVPISVDRYFFYCQEREYTEPRTFFAKRNTIGQNTNWRQRIRARRKESGKPENHGHVWIRHNQHILLLYSESGVIFNTLVRKNKQIFRTLDQCLAFSLTGSFPLSITNLSSNPSSHSDGS